MSPYINRKIKSAQTCWYFVTDSQVLSRKHPLASWFSTMLMCFASIVLTNAILGEPPITPFTNQRDLLTATIVWYRTFMLFFSCNRKQCVALNDERRVASRGPSKVLSGNLYLKEA